METQSAQSKKTREQYITMLRRYNHAYYNVGSSEVSDTEYDRLKDEFRRNYPDDPFLAEIGAPVDPQSKFSKVTHEIPMNSLEKAQTESDLRDWTAKAALDGLYCVSDKIDGLSLNIIYWNGELRQAVTRGDGIEGDDVTANVRKMRVPKSLPVKATFNFRAEIAMRKSVFGRKYAATKANPRNAAVGITKRLDGVGCEDLDIVFYNIHGPNMFHVEHQKFDYMKNILGLQVPNYKRATVEEIISLHEQYEASKRAELDFEIDGFVISVDSIQRQEFLGEKDRYPNWAIAYKFESEKATTPIKGITWQVGRTGVVTPVAQIEPVRLAGAMISNVTLHNVAEIERLGVQKGSQVVVKRSGDVIPKIISVANPGEGTELELPRECPVCESTLENNDVQLRCVNLHCPAKTVQGLIHWITTFDVMDFGEKLVEQLCDAGHIEEPADLYTLETQHIAELEGRGAKTAQRVLENLHAKKSVTLDKFLAAFGINGLGNTVSKLLVSEFHTLENVLKAKEEDLLKIQGIGEMIATNVVHGLQLKAEAIANVLPFINIIQQEKKSSGLAGSSFCFTGFRDKEMEASIESHGGKISSSVSAKTTYLVVGDGKPSSKRSKAEQLGVKVLNREQLQELLDNQ